MRHFCLFNHYKNGIPVVETEEDVVEDSIEIIIPVDSIVSAEMDDEYCTLTVLVTTHGKYLLDHDIHKVLETLRDF